MSNKFEFSNFYIVLCNLGFTICGSYIEQVWPPLVYRFSFVVYLFSVETYSKHMKLAFITMS